MPGVVVGAREQHAGVGLVGQGGEHLAAVQEVPVATPLGEGFQIPGRVRAAAGLGERPQADGPPADQVRNEAPALFVCATDEDGVRAGQGQLVVAQRKARVQTRHFLRQHGHPQKADVAAAKPLREHRAEPAGLAGLLHQRARKLARRLVGRQRRQDGAGHVIHEGIAQLADVIGQKIVHVASAGSLTLA